jgi:pyruvate/2-oxoglutarate dehydrogenase complex dihydrolipoamide dehydrogenase (E3) component
MADNHFDIIVIGGGPGGYVGAIRAAQLGYKTAIIDRAKLGGVCLNWGCIPSKALLSNAELMEKLAHKQDWGLEITGEVKFDWDKVIGRSRGVAEKLNKGVEFLMKKNKIEHLVGHAKITKGATGGTPCEVELYDCEVKEELTSAPRRPPTSPARSSPPARSSSRPARSPATCPSRSSTATRSGAPARRCSTRSSPRA